MPKEMPHLITQQHVAHVFTELTGQCKNKYGMTLRQLAAKIGRTDQSMSNYRRGDVGLKFTTAYRICRILNYPFDQFLNEVVAHAYNIPLHQMVMLGDGNEWDWPPAADRVALTDYVRKTIKAQWKTAGLAQMQAGFKVNMSQTVVCRKLTPTTSKGLSTELQVIDVLNFALVDYWWYRHTAVADLMGQSIALLKAAHIIAESQPDPQSEPA